MNCRGAKFVNNQVKHSKIYVANIQLLNCSLTEITQP